MSEQAPGRSGSRWLWLMAIPAVVLLLLGAVAWNGIHGRTQVGGSDGESVNIHIPPGSTAGAIARSLHEQGVLDSPFWFRLLVRARGAERGLRAGKYSFQGRLSADQVLEQLRAGPPGTDLEVTIPEGLTVDETIHRLVKAGLGTAEGFEQALLAVMPLVHGFDPLSDDAEGYLFPDTYRFAENWSENRIIRTLIFRFLESAAITAGQTPGGANNGFTIRETVTLASLVEKETGVSGERTLVAGVFANRLRLGMRLQCDPTVLYALHRAGRTGNRLLRADLQFDSPWNTYLYPGLPPGPICCPGEAALQAASLPADTPYLYFVADGRGGHSFSQTLGEHNRAVARYRAWQRQNR